ncbi:MAG TPA: AAA family ATPase [Ramlibacter sp.]|uniref:trifunctional serine/threonine-protein kinase/ATP-binding protein/sensor histidine kinase n=1 Tax=Ramlibacter sp. TaxID=1917967 RepID=UPI002C5C0835|nr:AAA family ATPase [Ramlibacter sp.]HVZ45076.1 AAA family ATPase [Ramlibacter sp.]
MPTTSIDGAPAAPGIPAGDDLYASDTARVYRVRDGAPAGTIVYKEFLGPDALARHRNEHGTLQRLAGIGGVAQLAPVPPREGILALADCGGETLSQSLRGTRFDAARVIALATRLARTLADVHRAGVIHRDINPSNIMLASHGEPVLIDFDLAVAADHPTAALPDGRIAGTLAYLAPEQTGRTGRPVDQRADLYALGATLYEMATGKLPFDDEDALQLIHDHLTRVPVAPCELDADIPLGLSDIILRLLAKAPEQRYQSAEGLLHDLLKLRAELDAAGEGIFELGERDFPLRLEPPGELVGRSTEMAMLRKALADAVATDRRAVLIEGAAGVGKTALIGRLVPLVTESGGWFVQGKFDPYQREGATGGGVTQALRALGRLLLTLPRAELSARRRRITHGLGRGAALIARWLPEFALLIGSQPEAPEADPRQAGSQLHQAIVDLLGAIVSPEQPLVIALDDLQWAGPQSLRAFSRLMNAPGLQGLLLIGAYRPEDVDTGQELAPVLANWRAQPQPPAHIRLANLDAEGMGELIARMLRLSRVNANELARAVGAFTNGNPFDTVEMVNALRHEGVLRLAEPGWQWDEQQVRRFVGRGNVVDLLAARIERLPAAARELLECMSCLGNAVETRLLAAVAGLGEADLEERLRPAIEDGLVVAAHTEGVPIVQFRHDRVQQATLGSMRGRARDERQLAMARRLAPDATFEAEAAEQYFSCVGLLDAPQERRVAARLFHGLARKLLGAARYPLAERYLDEAARLIAVALEMPDAEDGRDDDAQLRAAIDVSRHAALYSLGRLDDADPLHAAIEAHTSDPLELVEPACLQMRSLFMRGRSDDAKRLGSGLLVRLGLAVPADYAADDTARRLDAISDWIAGESGLDHALRPQIEDGRLLAIAKLLSRMARPAFFSADTKAFVWLMLESQRLWAEHGACQELVASLGRMGGVMIGLRGDYRAAFEITRHVLQVGEALGYEPQTSEARGMYAGTACHWFEPLETTFHHAKRAYEGMQAAGDLSYACYVHRAVVLTLLDLAPTLDTCDAEVEAGLALCARTGNIHAAALHECDAQLLRSLRGPAPLQAQGTPGAAFDEDAFLERAGGFPQVLLSWSARQAMRALIMGELDTLERHADRALSLIESIPGYYMAVHVHLAVALARAWRVHADASTGAAQRLAELEASRAWLAARAADQPYNFAHLLRLVEAEEAWARGDLWKAGAMFDAAVLEAETRARPWHRALIMERAGLFLRARGLARLGLGLLAEARDEYQAWGAVAKVARMVEEHALAGHAAASRRRRLPATTSAGRSGGVSSDALDLMGVLRASQALSSETSLERLAARVTQVLAALTGATKVLVLACNDDQWWLLAPAPGESSVPVAQAGERGLLPLSAFGYAERTRQPLLVDNALSDERFARDPYFAGVPLCSLLAAPIAGQSATRAMLLLENRQGRAAFNAERLDAVMLIAGQLAVSLANAQLYESLEQRVRMRTRELEQIQAQLVTTARRAGKAEIAANVLHNVGNVLNSINVSAGVMRTTIGNSRIDGLRRAVALLNAHEGDLAEFMGPRGQGKALLDYLNDLVEALGEERREMLGDLDRLVSSVDHVSYIVATQQSHAGPSSLQEIARPQELLEEALRMSGETIARCEVEVVRRYEHVPATALDKPRLLQILVNLIGNAAQAMEDTPARPRRLTLASALVRDADGERLRITVQDEGEGIAPEHLGRLFAHGFTTRKSGHGFGLHSSALAALEMGGKLTAHSEGRGRGAMFALEVPFARGGWDDASGRASAPA